MRSTRVFGLVGLLVLGSCALLPRPGEGPRLAPVVLDAPLEGLWEALPEIYERLDLGHAFADPRERSFGIVRAMPLWQPWIGPFDGPYLRCTANRILAPMLAAAGPGGPVAGRIPPTHVTLTVATTLAPAEEGTQVSTRVTAVDSGADAGAEGSTHCVSTGRLESRILEMLEARIEASSEAR